MPTRRPSPLPNPKLATRKTACSRCRCGVCGISMPQALRLRKMHSATFTCWMNKLPSSHISTTTNKVELMKHIKQIRRARRGNIIVLSAVLMVAMMAMIAFAVDLGYLYNARTEMQRAADASAIAACWELIDEDVVTGASNSAAISDEARSKARQFVALNKIAQASADLSNDDISV